ncbi:sensor histidine kinase [Cohnella sp. GCM10020058]|uniref:sensor histidine kinase n=1 Tax=Cohnella sp. GCM10020058 TaxID=3317330 RepID=UPI003626B10F
MIKSLYVRIVLTFLAAVIVSLFLSLLLIVRLFETRATSYVQDEMIANGKDIIESYVGSYPEHSEMLAKGIAVTSAVNFYGSNGQLLHGDVLPKDKRIAVDAGTVRFVLEGGVYRGESPDADPFVVGLPFQIGSERFALFTKPAIGPFMRLIGNFFRFELLFVLLIGSVLILIAARFIVRPLKRLTDATRRMSKGDFGVVIRSKRKDEIGQLTRSFNLMAQELGALEKTRQRFVSNVSHEIQSPLTSIKGFTKALKHKKMDEEKRLQLLSVIEEETERLSRLGEDLLQLSSLEYEHLELNLRAYRLDEQLRKAVIALEPQWTQKSLRIELDLVSLDIVADEDRIYQLWINLLGNAIKFTGPDGEIRLSAGQQGETAIVSVQDTGAGIPEGQLDAIFQPFYKVDPSRTRAVPGNGIGLSIVKRIVGLHQGDIQVTSTLGEGTTFSITLPLDPPSRKM